VSGVFVAIFIGLVLLRGVLALAGGSRED